MSDQPRPEIYERLARVAGKLPAVPKTEEVDTGRERYAYRGIANIIDVVHGPLAEAGIVVVPEVLDVLRCEPGQTRSGTPNLHLIVRYAHTFFAPDGSSVRAVTLGEGVDTSDKAANKCHSAALKYALNEVLLLAYGVEEQDAERPELPAPNYDRRPAPPPPAAPRPAAPAAPPPSTGAGPRCPKCDAPMVLKQGKKGDFWGCTRYKEGCRGTVDAQEWAARQTPGQNTQAAHSAPAAEDFGNTIIGDERAEALKQTLIAAVGAVQGDPVAVRNYIYGKWNVARLAHLNAQQEEEVRKYLAGLGRAPVDDV